jgi:hypothetical protein
VLQEAYAKELKKLGHYCKIKMHDATQMKNQLIRKAKLAGAMNMKIQRKKNRSYKLKYVHRNYHINIFEH